MMDDILSRWNLRPPDPYGMPYVGGEEAVHNLIKYFNEMPVTYDTDPYTGKVIASKNMAKPYGPNMLDPMYTPLFRSPFNPSWQAYEPNLWASWVLPKGALTGEKFIQNTPPVPDISRAMEDVLGVSNIGESSSYLNPQTHWPKSAFKVGLREPSAENPYAYPEPMFGTTIDYTQGSWHAPPIPNIYSQTYGRIDPSRKTPPGWGGTQKVGPVQTRQSLLRRMY